MNGKLIRIFVNEDLELLTNKFIRVCGGFERVKNFPKELLVGDTDSLDERVDRKIAIMWDIIAEKFLNYVHFKSAYCSFDELINNCMDFLDKNGGKENSELEALIKDIKNDIRFKKSEDEDIGVIIEKIFGDVFDERYILFYLKKMYDSLNDVSRFYVDVSFVSGMLKGMNEVLKSS